MVQRWMAVTLLLCAPAIARAQLQAPHNGANMPNGCSECHNLYGPSFGKKLDPSKGATINGLCQSCHYAGGPGTAAGTHQSLDCTACHNPHVQEQNVLNGSSYGKFIRSKIGGRAVVFTGNSGTNSFADDDAVNDGVCEVCHTKTAYHKRTGGAGGDSHHNAAANCMQSGCHSHSNGFTGSCSNCHDKVQGSRRVIFGTSGDFARSSHHVQGPVQGADCTACHDMSAHKGGTVRLKDADTGATFAFPSASSTQLSNWCLSCHDSDGANGDTTPFTDNRTVPNIEGSGSNSWAASAHASRNYPGNGNQPISCYGNGTSSGCHDNGHGSDNIKLLSASSGVTMDSFCFGCHTQGGVTNNALGNRLGHNSADDIEQAFGYSNRHNMGTSFTISGKSFTLQCTSCHNPHIATGRYWDAASNQSPISRPDFSDPTNNPRGMGSTVWGDAASEKTSNYVGSGMYTAPNNDVFTASQLPDYVTFCQGCHSQAVSPGGAVSWSGVHGTASAGPGNGGGTAPNWYTFGKAFSWDGDVCNDTTAYPNNACWPPRQRGYGQMVWTRSPYDQLQRMQNANFVLSCIDCHEAHGSARGSFIRERFNTNSSGACGTGTSSGQNCNDGGNHNQFCNTCHYYYSDWHAGMSCGSASCHVSNSLHRMSNAGHGGSSVSYDQTLVLYYAFDGNLKDSGDWKLHGRWLDGIPGSYAAGHSGSAVVLDDAHTVQVGTENSYWSTDEGHHGTWKYTHLKFHATMEAWVYPTDTAGTASEYTLFSKHTGTPNGDCAFSVRRNEGVLRAYVSCQLDNNGLTQAGAAGLRGAYSSVVIPYNQWSHVAFSFDTAGPDRSAADPAVGRFRVYVNGNDVTTSDASGSYMQPGANETSIYTFPDNSGHNETVCYNGSWCAGEFSVGGFHGWQDGFIGRIDEAKVWNVTKPASHFTNTSIAPLIGAALSGVTQVDVHFTEPVYASSSGTGALQPSDFAYLDKNGNGAKTITAVSHTAGATTATLTLGSAMVAADLDTDAIRAHASSIYDADGNAAPTSEVAIGGELCPGDTTFSLNEGTCAATATETTGNLLGTVGGTTAPCAFQNNGAFNGDGASTYVNFTGYDTCFKADRLLTVEARIYVTGIPADTATTYVKRIFARDSGGANYQVSVWRNCGWATYPCASGQASVALWVKPKVIGAGDKAWKPVLSLLDADKAGCSVTNNTWLTVKAVWDADASGIPGRIYVNGVDCTNLSQTYNASDQRLQNGDEISTADGNFTIGANRNLTSANHFFTGQIDWLRWQRAAN